MNLANLQHIIQQGEGIRIEFKEATTSVPALPSSLMNASWKEVLLHLVPSWTQKGTQLDPLDWPKYQAYIKEEIEKVPSLIQKGTQLLRKYEITEQGKSFLSGQDVTDRII